MCKGSESNSQFIQLNSTLFPHLVINIEIQSTKVYLFIYNNDEKETCTAHNVVENNKG